MASAAFYCSLAAFAPPASTMVAPALARAGLATMMAVPPPETRTSPLSKLFKGRVVPTQNSAPAKVEEEEEGEMSIDELLSNYGIIALLFHFTVWITSLASVFALLSFGVDIDEVLPEWLLPGDAGDGADGAAGASLFAARTAATLAVVEAVGPARLALTVAATPKVSERAREYQVVRDFEELATGAWDRVTGGSR